MDKLVEIKHLNLIYQSVDSETHALDDINLEIDNQEFVSIVGPSGCGKTTILSLISGLMRPTSGDIKVAGKSPSPKDNLTGYMFQRDNLFPWRTIYKNVSIGLEIKHKKKDAESLKHVDELLNKYGLYEFRNNYPSQLSGGMRQRAALIRTLCLKPKILLLDEPFSALDYQTKLSVCDDVHSIITKEKQTAGPVSRQSPPAGPWAPIPATWCRTPPC